MGNAHVWLSGRFLPGNEATVPVTSRTVRQGFGLYETMRLVGGSVPLLSRHLDRVESAARVAGVWLGDFQWEPTILELARRNGLSDAVVRLTLGDGFSLVTVDPLPDEVATQRRDGLRLMPREHVRAFPQLKTVSRFDLDLLERQEYGEALLVTPGGEVLETTRASFFALTDAGIRGAAPPAVLPGIGREILLEVAGELGIAVDPRPPRLDERASWREALTTSAVRGVRPVVDVGGHALPSADAGARTRELQHAFDARAGWS